MKAFGMALALVLCATAAYAIVARPDRAPGGENKALPAPAAFTCAPAGFTLTRTADGLRLTGSIDTPTPGYAYEITDEAKDKDGTLKAVLRLKGPDGVALQVISTLEIDHTFRHDARRIDIAIEKEFDWGDPSITCDAGNAQ